MNTNKDNDMPDVIYAGIARSLDGEEVGGYWQANPEGEDKYLSASHVRKEKLELLDKVHRNVIANFRGNNEGLYNVKGFIDSLRKEISEND